MCTQPGKLADGTEIACRKCKQCCARKVNDWVGRCIAEKQYAVAANFITLTYGRDEDNNSDHLRAAWLTYSDVQKYFKRLRKAGYEFRYLLAGEYGSQKGRAHWHIIMYWKSKVPPHELTIMKGCEKRFHDKFWDHGHQVWQKVTEESIRYVCKYIWKDATKDEAQNEMRMSKKPPIGYEYFRDYAERHALQGLSPQHLLYSFPDVRGADGKPKQFYMSGATARNYIADFKAAWAIHHGGHPPHSPMLQGWDERQKVDRFEPTKGRWSAYVPPLEMGSGPFVGRDPVDGRMKNYSDLNGYRWWYRQQEEGNWMWQRGERISGYSPPRSLLPGQNRYAQAKAGQEVARPRAR